MIQKVNLKDKFSDHWSPKIAGTANNPRHQDEGEFMIIPRGVEQERHMILFEPVGTLNIGNVRDARTVEALDTI